MERMTCGFRNEWPRLLQKSYGTTFTLGIFQIEKDRMMNSLDIEIMLLGLGVYLCISLGEPRQEVLDAIKSVAPESLDQKVQQ